MKLPRALATSLLACAAVAAVSAAPARAQTATGVHEVRKGEGLYAIAGKTGYKELTRFQVVIGIYRANQDAFPDGNINVLREGQILRIPSREAVAAIAPAEAARLWQSLTARPAPPPVPVATVVAKPPKPPVALPPGREEAMRRYGEGLALERKGDHAGALKAFLDSGEAGYGLAQRRLGQIYDTGNTAVRRDYQASLRWYQKAREQGVEIDKPVQRMIAK